MNHAVADHSLESGTANPESEEIGAILTKLLLKERKIETNIKLRVQLSGGETGLDDHFEMRGIH